MKQHYDIVIFDWDGTLMDSTGRIVACLREASLRAGLVELSSASYLDVIGLSLEHALQALHPEATAWQMKVMDAVYRWQFMEACAVEMSPYAGAEALLKALVDDGVRLAVATGKSRHGLDLVLDETGFRSYFVTTKSAEETASKPDPKMLAEILAEQGVPLNRALMVGDSVFDLEMAQHIGMDAVAITHGVHGMDRLQVYRPVEHFDCLQKLHDWLL